ncbi:MAG: DUF445 family protein [Chitinivibrionales bacterium]|nr:DUF445 family protein [Chitinivibrionales bacterium]
MNLKIVFICFVPLISGLIGWMTNYIAVKMIFRPRKQINILGMKIIGLIPKRKADLARKIGETVEKELISHKDIQEIMRSPSIHNSMIEVLSSKIDDFFLKIATTNPLIGMFLNGETADQIKEKLVAELEPELPEVMDKLLTHVESKMDFKEIVQDKIEGFDLLKLENIIYGIAKRELKAIEILGGVLGFVIGIIQVGIIFAGNIYG